MTREDVMGASEDMNRHTTAVVAIINSRELTELREDLTIRERTNTILGRTPPGRKTTFLRRDSVLKTGAGTTRSKSVTASRGETKIRTSTNQTRVGRGGKIREGDQRRKRATYDLA